jgi:uncharacterized repeat protein (TIGR01451 family)
MGTMKSRALERSGSGTPDSRAPWTKRVILGGLGTAGASIALAALAASAFANAANPLADSSGVITPLAGGAVRVDVSGTWDWGTLSGSSPQKDCSARSGVGYSVDWWGISSSQTPKAITDGTLTGSLVNATTSSKVAPSTTSGTLTPSTVKNGAPWAISGGGFFHTTHQFNGFDTNICGNTSSGFPQGHWAAFAIYPSASDVPPQLCVNFYDPHGSENSYSTSTSDNYADLDGDNSIKTNDFNPASNAGYCFSPHFANPVSISLVKGNDANQNGTFTQTETATAAGQTVQFKLTVSNNKPTTTVLDGTTDSVAGGAGFSVCDGQTTATKTQDSGWSRTTLGAQGSATDSATCTFTLTNYAPTTGQKDNTATVNAHEQGNTNNTTSAQASSTVLAPAPTVQHLSANIFQCVNGQQTTLPANPAGTISQTSGTPSFNSGPSIPSTAVAVGDYGMHATIPAGFDLVQCGSGNGTATDKTAHVPAGQDVTVNFYVQPAGSPNIVYGKTGPSTGIAGATGDYTITLSNQGGATANGPLTFVDVLPPGETFNSVQPVSQPAGSVTSPGMSCSAGPVTVSGQLVTCTYSNDLAKGSSATVVIRANFAPGTEGQTLRDCTGNTQNTANVCWNTNIPQPNLTITKSGPGTGVPGGSGTYTITVKNTGQAPATSVSFVDQLPADESFVSAAGGDFNCTVNPNDATKINCTAKSGLLPLGINQTLSVNVLVTYALTASEGEHLTDCAILPNLNQDCATTIIHKPDVTILKTGPATGTAGGQGVYTITVKNTGQAAANNVTFTDSLPVGESYVSFSSSTVTCALSANPQVVNCSLNGPLASGASVSVDVTVAYGANTGGQTLTDCAILMTGNQSCVPTKIPSTPSISVVKTNDANGDGVFHDTEQANAAGDSVTFKVVVTNTSADPIVIDSVNDAFANTTALAECPQLIGVVLNSGDSVSCTFTVDNYAPAAGDSLTNTITVGGHQNTPGGTPVTATDTSTVTTKVPSAVDLAILKTADKDSVKAGNTLTYTLGVTNVGQSPTTGAVTVTDSVPSGLDLVSVDGGTAWDCTISNGTDITCTYLNGVLNPGDAAPLITVVTTVNDTAAISVINTGVVKTPGDVNPANDRSTVKTPVTAVLPIKIVKPTTPTTPTVLPFTGDRTAAMLPVGLAAILGGLLLMVAGRRRRRTA